MCIARHAVLAGEAASPQPVAAQVFAKLASPTDGAESGWQLVREHALHAGIAQLDVAHSIAAALQTQSGEWLISIGTSAGTLGVCRVPALRSKVHLGGQLPAAGL